MKITCTAKNRILTVKISGEIDHCTAEDIKYKIDKEYNLFNARDILFDFQDVTFMDSSGIGVIIGRYKSAETRGGTVAAANISPELNRIFDISGLFKIINFYDDTETAFNALKARR